MKNQWITVPMTVLLSFCLVLIANAQIEKAPEKSDSDQKTTQEKDKTDQKAEKQEQKEQKPEEKAVKADSFWIGIRVAPVPDIFLPHFGVKENEPGLLVVEQVLAKGPAEKAGLKRGDIILQFGEKDIHTLGDLLKQLSQTKETPQPMVVIRDGKKTDLTVTPEERPEISSFGEREGALKEEGRIQTSEEPEFRMSFRHPMKMMREMENYFRQMQGGADDGRVMAEETAMEADELPGGEAKRLEVSSRTDQDGKTKIHVTRIIKSGDKTDKKSWEADNIDGLPEEIRQDVEGLLQR